LDIYQAFEIQQVKTQKQKTHGGKKKQTKYYNSPISKNKQNKKKKTSHFPLQYSLYYQMELISIPLLTLPTTSDHLPACCM
jgi:hypothetical protein